MEPFSAMLPQDGLAECDRPGEKLPGLEIASGPRRGQAVRYIHSSTELSWLTMAEHYRYHSHQRMKSLTFGVLAFVWLHC